MDDQTTELARDIFIAFSESPDDVKSDVKNDDKPRGGALGSKKKKHTSSLGKEVQELKRDIKELRSLLLAKAQESK